VSRLVTLRTQYRNDAPIAQFISGLMYGDSLVTDRSVRERPPLERPVPGAHLILVDSSGIPGPRRSRRDGNPVHAQLIARVIRWIRTSDGSRGSTIAALSRFRDHVAAIKRAVPEDPKTMVGTVHGLQGSARPLS
jgi:hypothetical protein